MARVAIDRGNARGVIEVPDVPIRAMLETVEKKIGPATISISKAGNYYVENEDVFEKCPACGKEVMIKLYRDADSQAIAADCECGARVNFERWEW